MAADVFALRATVSNGFHAPGLGTQNLRITKVTPTAETLTAAVNSPAARALGATPLQPEKATNCSVGFTLNPTRAFHAAIDFNEYPSKVPDAALTASSRAVYNYQYTSGSLSRQGAFRHLSAAGELRWVVQS